mmetsp:Transcript_33320/g.106323  ORF Transcript_33320/g.106323 Transcript_33320/m.106323 type:complete len:521 (+) Transcript_33320:1093-2655(+)
MGSSSRSRRARSRSVAGDEVSDIMTGRRRGRIISTSSSIPSPAPPPPARSSAGSAPPAACSSPGDRRGGILAIPEVPKTGALPIRMSSSSPAARSLLVKLLLLDMLRLFPSSFFPCSMSPSAPATSSSSRWCLTSSRSWSLSPTGSRRLWLVARVCCRRSTSAMLGMFPSSIPSRSASALSTGVTTSSVMWLVEALASSSLASASSTLSSLLRLESSRCASRSLTSVSLSRVMLVWLTSTASPPLTGSSMGHISSSLHRSCPVCLRLSVSCCTRTCSFLWKLLKISAISSPRSSTLSNTSGSSRSLRITHCCPGRKSVSSPKLSEPKYDTALGLALSSLPSPVKSMMKIGLCMCIILRRCISCTPASTSSCSHLPVVSCTEYLLACTIVQTMMVPSSCCSRIPDMWRSYIIIAPLGPGIIPLSDTMCTPRPDVEHSPLLRELENDPPSSTSSTSPWICWCLTLRDGGMGGCHCPLSTTDCDLPNISRKAWLFHTTLEPSPRSSIQTGVCTSSSTLRCSAV